MANSSDFTILQERLKQLEINTDLPVCPVVKTLNNLDPELREMIRRLVEDSDISMTRLYAELRRSGIVVGRNSISYHRRGLCTCSQRKALS